MSDLPLNAWIRKAAKDESASATVEFVLWLPLFVLQLTLIVDASLLLFAQGHLWRVASDTSRLIAVGSLTEANAPSFVQERAQVGQTYSVDISSAGNNIKTQISVPFSDVVTMASLLSGFDYHLSAAVVQRNEN